MGRKYCSAKNTAGGHAVFRELAGASASSRILPGFFTITPPDKRLAANGKSAKRVDCSKTDFNLVDNRENSI